MNRRIFGNRHVAGWSFWALLVLLAVFAAGCGAPKDESGKGGSSSANASSPNVVVPGPVTPDTAKPDAVKPDVGKPDVGKPDALKPDAITPFKASSSKGVWTGIGAGGGTQTALTLSLGPNEATLHVGSPFDCTLELSDPVATSVGGQRYSLSSNNGGPFCDQYWHGSLTLAKATGGAGLQCSMTDAKGGKQVQGLLRQSAKTIK